MATEFEGRVKLAKVREDLRQASVLLSQYLLTILRSGFRDKELISCVFVVLEACWTASSSVESFIVKAWHRRVYNAGQITCIQAEVSDVKLKVQLAGVASFSAREIGLVNARVNNCETRSFRLEALIGKLVSAQQDARIAELVSAQEEDGARYGAGGSSGSFNELDNLQAIARARTGASELSGGATLDARMSTPPEVTASADHHSPHADSGGAFLGDSSQSLRDNDAPLASDGLGGIANFANFKRNVDHLLFGDRSDRLPKDQGLRADLDKESSSITESIASILESRL